MHKIILSLALCCGLLLTNSCSKDKKTTTTGGGGTSWNWTGTEPFSVKLDGVSYTVSAADISIFDILGYYNINADLTDDLSIALSLQSGVAVGEYTTPSPNNFTHTNLITGYQGSALNSGGKIKIIQNTATTIEGKFYGTVSSPLSQETHVIAEGYFNITK